MPIADKRWSDAQKERIQNSRWQTTQKLVSLIQASARPTSYLYFWFSNWFITVAKALSRLLKPRVSPHDEFSHELCARWEQIANSAGSAETSVWPVAHWCRFSQARWCPEKMLPDPFTSVLVAQLATPTNDVVDSFA